MPELTYNVYSPVQMGHVPAAGTANTVFGKDWFDATGFDKRYFENTPHDAFHTGNDLNKNYPEWNGDKFAPCFVCFDGEIVFADVTPGRSGGVAIIIKHYDKHGALFCTRYWHIEPFRDLKTNKILLKPGDKVFAGQILALIGGADPDGVKGPKLPYYIGTEHLHFDIARGDILIREPGHWPKLNRTELRKWYLDPRKFLVNPIVPVVVSGVKMKVTALPALRRRAAPNLNSTITGRFIYNTSITVYKTATNGFYPLVDNSGWVSAEYLKEV